MNIIVATTNEHKVQELRELCAAARLNWQLNSLQDMGLNLTIEETGSTFEENAFIKAMAVFEHTGMATLADDSGLEVEALGNAPGVYSARYSGEGATDASNRVAVITELRAQHAQQSPARFRCVLCLVTSSATVFGEGVCEGHVTVEEKGDNGFGYDPMFVPKGYTNTFAELGAETKNTLSHRALAFNALVTSLADSQHHVHRVDSTAPAQPLASNQITTVCIEASIAAVTNNQTLIASCVERCGQQTEAASSLYEALLQTYLFAGFPAALDALTTFAATIKNVNPQYNSTPAADYNVQHFETRGQELCAKVYGSVFDKLMKGLSERSPDLARWMIVEGYGKVLSREWLPITTRELCIIAMMAILSRRTQLVSHIRGAKNVGVEQHRVLHCANIVAELAGKHAADLIEEIVKDVY